MDEDFYKMCIADKPVRETNMSFEEITREHQLWRTSLNKEQLLAYDIAHYVTIVRSHMKEAKNCFFHPYANGEYVENDIVWEKLIGEFNIQVTEIDGGTFWHISKK